MFRFLSSNISYSFIKCVFLFWIFLLIFIRIWVTQGRKDYSLFRVELRMIYIPWLIISEPTLCSLEVDDAPSEFVLLRVLQYLYPELTCHTWTSMTGKGKKRLSEMRDKTYNHNSKSYLMKREMLEHSSKKMTTKFKNLYQDGFSGENGWRDTRYLSSLC